MSNKLRGSVYLILGILIALSCNEPTSIGLNILDDDVLQIDVTDQVDITARPVLQDSVQVYPISGCYARAPQQHPIQYYITHRTHSQFGPMSSQIYSEFVPSSVVSEPFDDVIVDSVRLRIMYDAPLWGDTLTEQHYLVHTIQEALSEENYYSNQNIMISPDPIAELRFAPRPKTNTLLISNRVSPPDTSMIPPSIQFEVDKRIGEMILSMDTTVLKDDSLFLEVFNGILIRAEEGSNAALSFDLKDINSVLSIYYTRADTAFGVFNLRSGFTKKTFATIDHDYSNSEIGGFIGDEAYGDNYIVADAFVGVETEFTIQVPDLDSNVIIHQASLELTSMQFETDPLRKDPSRLLLYELDDEGKQQLISTAVSLGNDCFISTEYFGRSRIQVSNGQKNFVYQLNITKEIQQQLKHKKALKLILSSENNLTEAAPFMAYGVKHDLFPVRLNISYTKY